MTLSVPISDGQKCLVQLGSPLTLKTPLFEAHQNKSIQVSVAQELGVPADKIFRYVKKFLGEVVKKGEILAEKKKFLSTSAVVSHENGFIREIDHERGIIFIEVEGEDQKMIYSPVVGEIVSLTKDVLTVKTAEQTEVQGISNSPSFGGEVYYDIANDSDLTTISVEDRIIYITTLNSFLISKCEALGARGFIVKEKLKDSPTSSVVQIKTASDFEKVKTKKLPYCYFDKNKSTIFFYRQI